LGKSFIHYQFRIFIEPINNAGARNFCYFTFYIPLLSHTEQISRFGIDFV